MNSRNHTLRNTLFSSVGLYTEFALGMLTSIVVARHLGPHEFGAYSGVIWLMAIGTAIANAGTASAAIKFIAELRSAAHTEEIPPLLAYLRRAQRMFLLAVLAASALLLLLAGQTVVPSLDTMLVLGFLLATVPLRAAYMFNVGTAKGFENFRANAMVVMVAAPANLLMAGLVAWLDMSVYWQLGVFFASSVLFFAMSARQVAPLMPTVASTRMSAELVRRVRHHMFYSALTVAVGFVVSSEAEVMFLNLHQDEHGAGIFKVAYQLAYGAAMLVPGVFGALLLPMMAGAQARGQQAAGRKFVASTTYLFLLAAPLVAVGCVFADSLVKVLYGAQYAEAGPMLAICLAGTALTVATQGGSSLLISADRQRSVLVVVGLCCVLKVGLDWGLIRAAGLHGAVTAFLIVCIVQAAGMMVLAIRSSGAMPEWGRLLRIAAMSGMAALVVLPLRGRLDPWVELPLAGALFLLTYLALTVVFGCWSRADIEHLQSMHPGLRSGGSGVGNRLLAWAHGRAYGGAMQ